MVQSAPEPGNWLDGLGFDIWDPTGGGGGGGAAPGGLGPSGQGFSLSRDEAMSMLNQAKGIRADLWAMIKEAEQLTKMKPPADEPASKAFNVLAAGGGGNPGAFGYGVGHIKREHGYVDELITRLEDALHLAQSSDESAATDMNKTASSGGYA
ncbi:hypothetical protein ATK36_5266 [Amycolatopsis sulphurea]|uniref:Uncharacterized protein n=1 Tax=Amycolatopsis sulphurea TaxID=76022 RepID=A0A2A9FFB1_9PSEU|nr:hypothetical protein [Amycolatopsis sulphurea]PFG50064.1 hypothetical protein ATK36_5266 [Amycolatopsis sulphurea]